MMAIWRRASCSIAWPMKRTEFTFLISQRVPSGSPGRRTDTLPSAPRVAFPLSPAQVPLLHVAVAGAEVPQDGAHLADERLRLLGGAQVRPGDDLHQRGPGAI